MDKDPLQAVEEALKIDDLKQDMYRSALLLLMNNESDTHIVQKDLVGGKSGEVPFVRNDAHRKIDIEGEPGYESLRKYGLKAVELTYMPSPENTLDSLRGETVVMAVQYGNGDEHILKMRVENSDGVDEIEATASAHIANKVYLSDDASQFDLEEMQRIAEAVERADT